MDINSYKPTGTLNKKHFVSLQNYTEEDIYEILKTAKEISERLAAGEKLSFLKNKYVYLITKSGFSRSRIAFETAVAKLSGSFTVSTLHGSQLEEILDDKYSMAAIASYGVNAIVVRTEINTDAETLEKSVDLPIINANPKSGPCEALAALYTVWEKKGRLKKLKVTMIGNADEFADGFVYAFIKCGADVTLVCPKECRPNQKIVGYCEQYGGLNITDDLREGLTVADVVYVSEDGLSQDYTVTADSLEVAKPSVCVLHVLPLVKGGNLDQEVAELPSFAGLDQAENLQKIEMALFALLVDRQN